VKKAKKSQKGEGSLATRIIASGVSTPKKHHYLPEFYLKKFSTAGELWVYDRERDTYDKRRPEITAIRKGFYAIKDEHGKKDYGEVERRLSVIESHAALAIQKLDGPLKLKVVELNALALFVALLKFRIPAFERQMNEIGAMFATVEEAKELLAPSVESVQQKLEQQGYNGADSLQEARRIYEKVHAGEYQVDISPDFRIQKMAQYSDEITQAFLKKPWTLVRSPEGSSFITSEDPLVVIELDNAPDIFSYTGPETIPAGFDFWIPLSPRTCLVIGNEACNGRVIKLQKTEVRAINVMIAAQCERFFMAGDEALLRRVARSLPRAVQSGWSMPEGIRLPECFGYRQD